MNAKQAKRIPIEFAEFLRVATDEQDRGDIVDEHSPPPPTRRRRVTRVGGELRSDLLPGGLLCSLCLLGRSFGQMRSLQDCLDPTEATCGARVAAALEDILGDLHEFAKRDAGNVGFSGNHRSPAEP